MRCSERLRVSQPVRQTAAAFPPTGTGCATLRRR